MAICSGSLFPSTPLGLCSCLSLAFRNPKFIKIFSCVKLEHRFRISENDHFKSVDLDYCSTGSDYMTSISS